MKKSLFILSLPLFLGGVAGAMGPGQSSDLFELEAAQCLASTAVLHGEEFLPQARQTLANERIGRTARKAYLGICNNTAYIDILRDVPAFCVQQFPDLTADKREGLELLVEPERLDEGLQWMAERLGSPVAEPGGLTGRGMLKRLRAAHFAAAVLRLESAFRLVSPAESATFLTAVAPAIQFYAGLTLIPGCYFSQEKKQEMLAILTYGLGCLWGQYVVAQALPPEVGTFVRNYSGWGLEWLRTALQQAGLPLLQDGQTDSWELFFNALTFREYCLLTGPAV